MLFLVGVDIGTKRINCSRRMLIGSFDAVVGVLSMVLAQIKQ